MGYMSNDPEGYGSYLQWLAGEVEESNPVENPADWVWREDIGAWERRQDGKKQSE